MKTFTIEYAYGGIINIIIPMDEYSWKVSFDSEGLESSEIWKKELVSIDESEMSIEE